jgi:hypothetical protein
MPPYIIPLPESVLALFDYIRPCTLPSLALGRTQIELIPRGCRLPPSLWAFARVFGALDWRVAVDDITGETC